MFELALRNTNTCAQLQPHNLGPCNISLQCGKYQLDFKPSRAFSIISSYIQLFSQREVININRRRDSTWSQLKARQLGSHSLCHTVTHSHTQSYSLCHRDAIQSQHPSATHPLRPFVCSVMPDVHKFQHKCKELKVGGIIPKRCTKFHKTVLQSRRFLYIPFAKKKLVVQCRTLLTYQVRQHLLIPCGSARPEWTS